MEKRYVVIPSGLNEIEIEKYLISFSVSQRIILCDKRTFLIAKKSKWFDYVTIKVA